MTTSKLYYEDAYIKNFNASVLSCEFSDGVYKIILDKTAFFPEGGGQKADVGFIGDAEVFDVRESDGKIIHYTEIPLETGSEYECKINWQLRFSRMQNHSGEHIVSGIVHKVFGYDNVGFHMDDDCVTVDFNGELNREQLDFIENSANFTVYNNYKIICRFPEKAELDLLDYRSKLELTENVRLVEIENTDLCACCAPHVERTGEIGVIKILDFMRHRGGVRLVMKCGETALLDYRTKYDSIHELSGLLSAKQDEVTDYVRALMSELDSVRKDFHDFKMSVAENDRENLVSVGECAFFIAECYDSDMMRDLVNFGVSHHKLCAVFSGDDKSGYSYIIGSSVLDMRKFAKNVNDSLCGRGGGKDTMIQGKVTANKKQIADFIGSLSFE